MSGSVLTAESLEPASDSVCVSLCPTPTHTLSLSVSEINKHLKKILKKSVSPVVSWRGWAGRILSPRHLWPPWLALPASQGCPIHAGSIPSQLPHKAALWASPGGQARDCRGWALGRTGVPHRLPSDQDSASSHLTPRSWSLARQGLGDHGNRRKHRVVKQEKASCPGCSA